METILSIFGILLVFLAGVAVGAAAINVLYKKQLDQIEGILEESIDLMAGGSEQSFEELLMLFGNSDLPELPDPPPPSTAI